MSQEVIGIPRSMELKCLACNIEMATHTAVRVNQVVLNQVLRSAVRLSQVVRKYKCCSQRPTFGRLPTCLADWLPPRRRSRLLPARLPSFGLPGFSQPAWPPGRLPAHLPLYCTILCYAILHYAMLYYHILYMTIPYYIHILLSIIKR